MDTLFVILRMHGARWDPDKPVREQPLWEEHATFMDALFESGAIVLAGPFADRSASLVVVKAGDEVEVRAMFAADPWTVHDVLNVYDVKEWTIFLDGRDRQ